MRQASKQLPLALPVDPVLYEQLVVKKARELYRHSRCLSDRYVNFDQLMEDPVVGRCMRLSAVHLLHMGNERTQGR